MLENRQKKLILISVFIFVALVLTATVPFLLSGDGSKGTLGSTPVAGWSGTFVKPVAVRLPERVISSSKAYKPLFITPNTPSAAEKTAISSLPEIPLRKDPPVGIKNRGNSCYANSTLQALFRIPVLRKIVANFQVYRSAALAKIQEAKDKGKLVDADIFSKNLLIIEGLNHMFHQLQSNKSGEAASFDFEKSEQILQDEFSSFQQMDAHDFLVRVYEALKEFIPKKDKDQMEIKIRNEIMYTCTNPKIADHPMNNKSISTVNEDYDVFNLAIPENEPDLSLKKLLYHFFVPAVSDYKFDWEELSAGNSTGTRKITSLPDILPFQIKRFDGNNNKIYTPVSVPDEIDLAPYCDKSVMTAGSTAYRLKMFVYHIGSTRGGHYVAYTKEADGNWYLLNDSVASLIPSSLVGSYGTYLSNWDGKIYQDKNSITDTGYIYFYERKKDSGKEKKFWQIF